MRDLMNSAAVMRPVKKEVIVIDLDDDDDGDVLYGEVKEEEYMMDVEQVQANTSTDSGEMNPSNMQQIVGGGGGAAAADVWDTKIDDQYMKLLDSFREDGSSYLRDNPLRSIRYEVDNGGYDMREFKAVIHKQSREDRNTIRVTKKNVESKPHVQASAKKTTKELDENSVEAMLITSREKRNSQHNGDKENSEDQMVLDEGYRSYLKWLVENSKSSRTNPEKEIQVKREEDCTMSLSDSDSDIIAVEDRPFLDEENSPFVPSKSYKMIDLDDESSDQDNSWFRKEIMNVLKQPITEKELMELHNEAAMRRKLTRYWELRNGREISYTTKQEIPSYLDTYPDFKKKYVESLHEKDGHKAVNLLRGIIFYLTNVVRDDAFKPWLDPECMKITCSDKSVPALGVRT